MPKMGRTADVIRFARAEDGGMDNLNTAKRIKCPQCGWTVSVVRDAIDQFRCSHCDANIGHMLGKAWERAFDSFYSGDIPPELQVP